MLFQISQQVVVVREVVKHYVSQIVNVTFYNILKYPTEHMMFIYLCTINWAYMYVFIYLFLRRSYKCSWLNSFLIYDTCHQLSCQPLFLKHLNEAKVSSGHCTLYFNIEEQIYIAILCYLKDFYSQLIHLFGLVFKLALFSIIWCSLKT